MILLGYVLLFFFSALAIFLTYTGKGKMSGVLGALLFFILPVAGIYFLGWWALLAYFVGLCLGAMVLAGRQRQV